MPMEEQATNQRNFNSSPNVGGVLTKHDNFMASTEPANTLANFGQNQGASTNLRTAQSHYDSKENLNDTFQQTNPR